MSDLGNYIKESFVKGLKKPQIEASLLQSGWSKDQIEEAFKEVEFSQKEFIQKHKRRILPSKKVLTIILVIFFFLGISYKFFFYVDFENRCFVKILPSIALEFSNSNIKRSIGILKYGSPTDYQDFCRLVDTIDANVDCGGFEGGCYRGGKRIAVSTAQGTVSWTVAIIVHETCHAIQTVEGRGIGEGECYAAGDRILTTIVEI